MSFRLTDNSAQSKRVEFGQNLTYFFTTFWNLVTKYEN